ncbi:MAG: hypothetical protein ABEJ88_04695 [Halobacterium sp.]
MPGIRELLAVVLGVVLGVALAVAPRAMLRASVFVGPARRRRDSGPWGSDDVPLSDRWVWVIRALGVACIAVAAVVAYNAYVA